MIKREKERLALHKNKKPRTNILTKQSIKYPNYRYMQLLFRYKFLSIRNAIL